MKKILCLAVMFVLLASVVYATSVTLSWEAVADDDSDATTGVATGYDFRYSEKPITNDNFILATQLPTGTPKTFGQTETYTFSLPDGNKHFYFAMKTFDEMNNMSDVSNMVEVDFFPPAAVTGLRLVH